ncbi:MAG: hypothetical protein AB7O88_25705 [Reyranellaceae bacterium]
MPKALRYALLVIAVIAAVGIAFYVFYLPVCCAPPPVPLPPGR